MILKNRPAPLVRCLRRVKNLKKNAPFSKKLCFSGVSEQMRSPIGCRSVKCSCQDLVSHPKYDLENLQRSESESESTISMADASILMACGDAPRRAPGEVVDAADCIRDGCFERKDGCATRERVARQIILPTTRDLVLHSQVCDADTTTDRQTAKRHDHNGSARSRAIKSGATQRGRLTPCAPSWQPRPRQRPRRLFV